MERATKATDLDVSPSSIGTVGVTGCAGGCRGGGSAGAISFSKDRARGAGAGTSASSSRRRP
jgi:hypothetical protein